MANEDQEVIFKVKKVQEAGAHGGAWKIAYADFVTAMMAFFLLLWLLNATEQEVLEGISNYFTPTTRTTSGASGSGGLFGGITTNEPGPSETKLHTAALDRQTSAKGELEAEDGGSGPDQQESTGDVGELERQSDNQRFYSTKNNLEQALDQLPPELADLKQSVRVSMTKDGLQLEIVDQQQRENFKPGSAELTDLGKELLRFIRAFIEPLPNKISISGHTTPEESTGSPWELSFNRAAVARRFLEDEGLPWSRFSTIVGKADSQPSKPETPNAAENRRMVILLLRQSRKRTIQGADVPPSILD